MHTKLALVLLLFIFGISFRVVYPDHFTIGFDQVQILEKAYQIINGDVSLIGPRTGPANMFTGPLIYYVSAPFVLIFGQYLTIALVPLFLSLATGITIYWLVTRYVGNEEAIIALMLWAFSPFLISLDRVFWNPNITLLSSFLVFIPILKPKKNDVLSLLCIFLGSFLAYQSHFTGFVLLFLAFSTLVFRKSFKQVMVLVLGFIVSIVPTIVFDMRNNFLNVKGFMALFGEKGELNVLALLKDFSHNLYVIAETQGKLFTYGNSQQLILSLGCIIVLFFAFVKKHTNKNEHVLPITWLVSIAVLYSFYKGEKPEYYFLIAVPELFIISVKTITGISPDFQKAFLALFIISSLLMNVKSIGVNAGMTVKNLS